MKTIALRKDTQLKTKDVLTEILSRAPQGMNIDEMRRRMRVLDLLEKNQSETLSLEDADWQMVKQLYVSHPFAMAHKDLLTIGDDVENAA
jgi:hypothetical protein